MLTTKPTSHPFGAAASWGRWLRLRQRALVWGGCALALILAVVLGASDVIGSQQARDSALAQARTQAATASQAIEGEFGTVMQHAQRLAADLTQGQLTAAALPARLQQETQTLPAIHGLAVTFAPYQYQPQQRLYQVYWSKNQAGDFTLLQGATYDYTLPPNQPPPAPQTAWYHTPLTQGASWNEPFLATGAGEVLIEYGVPFYHGQGAARLPAGVVTLDYTLSGLRTLMDHLALGSLGYGMVLSPTGTVLAHPTQSIVGHTSLFDPHTPIGTQALVAAAHLALRGHASTTEARDPVTGETSWLFFRPLTTTHWALGIVLNQAELAPVDPHHLRTLVTILLLIALALVLALANWWHLTERSLRHWWRFVLAVSLVAVVLMGSIWVLAAATPAGTDLPLTSQANAERAVTVYTQQLPTAQIPLTIPTGIQITAITFPTASAVLINGFVWQRYDDTIPDDVVRGVAFTQQAANQTLLTEIQRVHQDHATLIVWSFGVQLAQSFDPRQFPFDQRTLNIRLVPLELNRNLVLIPDVTAYSFLKPSLLPGVNHDVAIPNWTLTRSSFHYQVTNYTADLGLPTRFERTNNPVLYFTVEARRDFLGPFIVYVLPALVVAGLLFAFLISNHRPDEPKEIITALSYGAALFFVITVAQTALRDNVAAVGITYLEYVYLLLYLAVLGVVVNSFLLARQPPLAAVHWADNALPKLLFWPFFTGILLAVTVGIFALR